VRFRAVLTSSTLSEPVIEEESTNIFAPLPGGGARRHRWLRRQPRPPAPIPAPLPGPGLSARTPTRCPCRNRRAAALAGSATRSQCCGAGSDGSGTGEFPGGGASHRDHGPATTADAHRAAVARDGGGGVIAPAVRASAAGER
jgi:hypothetical protein